MAHVSCQIQKSATIIYGFKPLNLCFAFILCRIGAFDLFYHFYACAGCSMSHAHFHSILVPEDNCISSLSITDAVGRF